MNKIPLETKCTWYDEMSGKTLTGWVVIVPARSYCPEFEEKYVLSTKHKRPSWSRNNDKAFWKIVPASKLEICPN